MKLFEMFDRQPLRETKRLNESIKLCKSVLALLEAEGDIEWEPQPQMKGVKGTTTDSGFGLQQAAKAKQAAANQKLNATWQKLLRQAKTIQEPEQSAKLKGYLKKIATAAAQRGFTLDPSPEDTLGLKTGGGVLNTI